MNEAVRRSFSRVLRLQLAAVQQHFIHVLLLRAWKEEAVAERILSSDAVDLPNAVRIAMELDRRCPEAGRVHVHFPRRGYAVTPA